MNNYKDFKTYSKTLLNALESVEEISIDLIKTEILKRIDGEGEIYIIGNGGSAANSHHIVGDYMKTFAILGKKLKLNSLSDNNCFITAASNDLDFSEIYEILIGSRIQSEDFLIFLSGSGNSINLVKAARAAFKYKIKTAAITSYGGGALKNIVDIPIHFKVSDMEIAEDCQLAFFHYIKQLIHKEIAKEDLDSSKYDKRIIEDLIA